MNKLVKCIVLGLSLITIGSIIFVIGGSLLYKNNGGFNLLKYQSKTYETVEDFKNIDINLITYDVTFRKSSDDKVKIEYVESEKELCSIAVVDSVLKITDTENLSWFDRIFSFGEKDMIIYLPEKEYGDLSMEITTSDVKFFSDATFSNVSVILTTGDVEGSLKVNKDLSFQLTTGDVEISNVNCEKISIVSTSGDVELDKIITSESFYIKTTTGDVKFTDCDSENIEIKTTTGDVFGTLLTGKIFDVKTTTGEKLIPQNSDGGNCKITVTTGDIKIKLI